MPKRMPLTHVKKPKEPMKTRSKAAVENKTKCSEKDGVYVKPHTRKLKNGKISHVGPGCRSRRISKKKPWDL